MSLLSTLSLKFDLWTIKVEFHGFPDRTHYAILCYSKTLFIIRSTTLSDQISNNLGSLLKTAPSTPGFPWASRGPEMLP